MGSILTYRYVQSYFFFSNWSGNIEALIRSAGSSSSASAISKKTSRQKPLASPGASIALIKERLTPAISASGATRWGIIRSSFTASRNIKKDTAQIWVVSYTYRQVIMKKQNVRHIEIRLTIYLHYWLHIKFDVNLMLKLQIWKKFC